MAWEPAEIILTDWDEELEDGQSYSRVTEQRSQERINALRRERTDGKPLRRMRIPRTTDWRIDRLT